MSPQPPPPAKLRGGREAGDRRAHPREGQSPVRKAARQGGSGDLGSRALVLPGCPTRPVTFPACVQRGHGSSHAQPTSPGSTDGEGPHAGGKKTRKSVKGFGVTLQGVQPHPRAGRADARTPQASRCLEAPLPSPKSFPNMHHCPCTQTMAWKYTGAPVGAGGSAPPRPRSLCSLKSPETTGPRLPRPMK